MPLALRESNIAIGHRPRQKNASEKNYKKTLDIFSRKDLIRAGWQ
jgi:hypothetical protein